MSLLLIATVWVHVVATIVWAGGMSTLILVVIPTTRGDDLREFGARFLSPIALRFRYVAWVSVFVLVWTGTMNLVMRGFGPGDVFTLAFLQGPYGRTVIMKTALVVATLLLSCIHDFRLGPRLSDMQQAGAPESETRPLRRRVLLFARVNVVLVLAILLLAVALPRGGLF